ncbi:Tripeptidyl aminopeptidase [Escovopsis weberi]|uniref:Tripeptidyl aminopeptidase n=1 Tax=Escovopsis weberi TaxID=150374 RepID=A0A0M8N3F0_ESCWE|nr:Tripeptidyl aminopeptidase [Escovopsis weberi]
MILGLILLSLLQAGSGLAAPQTGPLKWFSCQQNASMPVACGTIAVPLDYTDPASQETIDVQLIRFNATKQPVMGNILINPGGPGGSGREFLAGFAQEMMISTSGHYNLVGFETRGVGDTLPFSCFDSDAERATFFANFPAGTNDSDTSLGLTWAYGTAFAEICHNRNKDIGQLMSTAFIARDMMQIVDALEEDKLLRYYGFSYGTVLGATAAAMFPDRIARMVLDGVVNTPEWLYGTQLSEQSDAAVLAYFQSCLNSPDLCAIHRPNATASQLYAEVIALLEEIKYAPLVLGDAIVQIAAAKPAIFAAVKTGMTAARPLAAYLDAVLARNATAYKLALAINDPGFDPAKPPLYPNNGPEALYGIQCPDTILRPAGLPDFRPAVVRHQYAQSYFAGPPVVALAAACVQWRMRSRESFAGPFKATTRTPLLLISSPLDPATPMVSANNMTLGFDGSVVLQQNGIGHTSIAHPSTCTIKSTIAYFLNGTLPANGTVCEPDYSFFANKTLLEQYLAVEG